MLAEDDALAAESPPARSTPSEAPPRTRNEVTAATASTALAATTGCRRSPLDRACFLISFLRARAGRSYATWLAVRLGPRPRRLLPCIYWNTEANNREEVISFYNLFEYRVGDAGRVGEEGAAAGHEPVPAQWATEGLERLTVAMRTLVRHCISTCLLILV